MGKHLFQLILLFGTLQIAKGQDLSFTIDQADLKIDGFDLLLDKNVIIKHFGKPDKIFEPKYECGFLSENEQGTKFYSLKYRFLTFTGNDSEGYVLDELVLNSESKNVIIYKGKILSNSTSKKEFGLIFGIQIDTSRKLIYYRNRDDGVMFFFKDGMLNKITYWSPC